MTNNKQQTAVEWLWEIAYNRDLTFEDWKQAKEMEIEQKRIKLPSDEEIKKSTPYPLSKGFYNPLYSNKWEEGAIWMRDKIQGGEQ